MTPPFRYNAVLVHEWVRAPKIALGPGLEFRREGTHGASTRQTLQLYPSGAPALLEWTIKAKLLEDPLTYTASLLIDQVRVRGVDYHEIARSRFFRTFIPKGWHHDIHDPVQLEQRREPLAVFNPVTDLQDFTRKVAALWNIQLSEPPSLF